MYPACEYIRVRAEVTVTWLPGRRLLADLSESASLSLLSATPSTGLVLQRGKCPEDAKQDTGI
jgi:hypothetical protein